MQYYDEYPHLFDKPWQVHPDIDTPINDIPDDGKPFDPEPF